MPRSVSRYLRWLVPAIILLALLLSYPLLLSALGNYLVLADGPAYADAVLVLAGDSSGQRILTGAKLVQQGLAPHVLVSGPQGMYGRHEDALAIQYAVMRGFPTEYFVGLPHSATSTREEAETIVPELRRRQIRSYLLVTSNYHTRRAGRIFRAAGPDLSVRVVAAPYGNFDPVIWWQMREGRKIFALEWMKTVAEWCGL